MSSKSANDALALLVIYTCIKNKTIGKNEKRKKRVWVKERLHSHKSQLNAWNLNGPEDFVNTLRMDSETYMELLNSVTPLIQRKNTLMRDAISPSDRLSVTLRFLASGQRFKDLELLTNMSAQSIGQIAIETCEAISTCLKSFIQMPKTADEWKAVAVDFENKWDFINCIGAIDGKHVNIIRPSKSGAYYYNYKKNFSVVMMGLVNANYEFMAVEVGTNGKLSDEGVFGKSYIKQLYDEDLLNLPEPDKLNFSEEVLPYVIVGDESFPLLENLMTPYSSDNITNEEQIFNYRLSTPRQVADDAFRILADRFRVLRNTINLSPEKATIIAHTCCYLHNFLCERNASSYLTEVEGKFLTDLEPIKCTPSNEAMNVRNKFSELFNSVGKIY